MEALNARLPLTLDPLAGWTRTGNVEMLDGEVRRQHWWSSRLTEMNAAALLEAATRHEVPRLEGQLAGRRQDDMIVNSPTLSDRLLRSARTVEWVM